MAARDVFPNTVFVEGFSGNISRYDLLKVFGGNKGHIDSLEFTSKSGEPRKAFITYSDASSIPRALAVNGLRINNQPLVVRVVDETILCRHVPGASYDVYDALSSLQEVLQRTLDVKDDDRFTFLEEIDKLKMAGARDWATKAEFGNKVEQSTREKEAVEQESKTRLAHISTELEAVTRRCSQLQDENRQIQVRSTEVEANLKAAQELNESLIHDARDLRRQLEEHSTQKERTIEQLGKANNAVIQLNNDLQHAKEAVRELNEKLVHDTEELRRRLEETVAQKERTMERLGKANSNIVQLENDLQRAKNVSRECESSLRWTKSALDDSKDQAWALRTCAKEAQTKRQRAEEWLDDEREKKRRLVEDMENNQARHDASIRQLKKDLLDRQHLEERLKMETAARMQVEEHLAEANAKLERVPVTDALLAAFLKIEDLAQRVVEELKPSQPPP